MPVSSIVEPSVDLQASCLDTGMESNSLEYEWIEMVEKSWGNWYLDSEVAIVDPDSSFSGFEGILKQR